MDLIDRLISAAGGVADAADRFTSLFGRAGPGRRAWIGPVIVAGGSAVLAILFLLVGVEATDTTTPREVGAGIGEDPSFGDHAHVTVSGQVASEHGGHFFDDNGNGTQDPGELDADYVYVVADPTTHAALTVVSARPPSDIYRTSRVGQVNEDPSYIAEDLPYIGDDIRDLGITLDRDRYIDTRSMGDPTTIHLADGLPDPGTPVRFDDGILGTWTWICASGDQCDEADAESFDLLVYDDVSKRGIIVVTDRSPEWTPITFSGMLRREEHAVSEALDPDVFDLETMGVTVSSRYLLDDGTTPVSPMIAWVFAFVFAIVAGLILVGLSADYLIYRRASPSRPTPAGPSPSGARSRCG